MANQFNSWTNEELELLKRDYIKKGAIILSKQMNRSKSSIITKANRLGLITKSRFVGNKEDIIRKLEDGQTIVQIAKYLNRNPKTIISWCRRNDISIRDISKKVYAPRSSMGVKNRVKKLIPSKCEICEWDRCLEVAHII